MTTVPAGWYPQPSPEDPNRLRYFDGGKWTDHFRSYEQPDGQASEATSSFEAAYALDERKRQETPQAAAMPTEGQVLLGLPRPSAFTSPTALLKSAVGGVMALKWQLLGVTVGLAVLNVVIWVAAFGVGFTQFDSLNAAGFIAIFSLVGLLLVFVNTMHTLVVSRLLHLHHRKKEATLVAAFEKAKQRVLPYLGVLIATSIVYTLAVYLLSLIHVAALVVVLILSLFAMVKFAFLAIAAVATDPGDSIISASTEITSDGKFFVVLGRMVFLILPTLAVYLGTAALLTILQRMDGSALVAIALTAVFMIAVMVSALVTASGMVKLYLDAGGRTDI